MSDATYRPLRPSNSKTTCMAATNTAGFVITDTHFFIWFVLTQKEALTTIKSLFKVSANAGVNCSFVGRGQILVRHYLIRTTVI